MRVIHTIVEAETLKPVYRKGEYEVISILILRFPTELKNMRCCNCGKIVFKYEGKIVSIKDDGSVPKESAPTDHHCHRCKITYRIT